MSLGLDKEIVDDRNAPMNSCVLPSWALSAVCHVPGGAHPSYAHDYNERDNRFYQAWDPIARDRETFTAWINEYIHAAEVTAHAFLPPVTFNGHPLHQAMERTTPPSTRIAAPVVALA